MPKPPRRANKTKKSRNSRKRASGRWRELVAPITLGIGAVAQLIRLILDLR